MSSINPQTQQSSYLEVQSVLKVCHLCCIKLLAIFPVISLSYDMHVKLHLIRHIDTENIAMITPSNQQGEPLSGAICVLFHTLVRFELSFLFPLYLQMCLD